MWSKLNFAHALPAVVLAILPVDVTGAESKSICPVMHKKKLLQIELFDGKPEQQAFLAPDDDATGSNTYTIGAIYNRGDVVVIRCKYSQGKVVDIPLTRRVTTCIYSENRRKVPALYCK